MAKDSSFDVVSEVDMQEVRNAVDQASREISQRYDFKGTDSGVELGKRKVALKAVSHGKIEQAAGGTARQTLTLNQGIATEKAKEIVKFVKDMKVKAQGSVQGDQVRVSAKSRDALQDICLLYT